VPRTRGDVREAATNAPLQTISPFCLTVDPQATNYLPAVFGERVHALQPQVSLLPDVLLVLLFMLVTN
jgi:nitric oxide reductase NorD protein